MVFAISAAVAPPFSGLDTLPALGAVAIALSIILEDIVVLVAGIVIGTGGDRPDDHGRGGALPRREIVSQLTGGGVGSGPLAKERLERWP